MPTALPTGLVTLMFTDIVNSCAIKQAMPGATALRRDEAYNRKVKAPHDDLVLKLAVAGGGLKVSGTGDGFCLAFQDAEEAVLCGLAIQGQLGTRPIETPLGPLQVRIGIHAGQVLLTADGYTAAAMDMASRVTEAAGPGEVVVSPECHALVCGRLRNVGYASLGVSRLKGFGTIRLWRAEFCRNLDLRILLADDHEMVRHGLRVIIEEYGLRICGEASNGQEAVRLSRELKPDVVVMDVTMPIMNGLQAARQIRKDLSSTEVLILTMHESSELAAEAHAAGVKGFVLKAESGTALIAALHSLAHHKPYFTRRMSPLHRRRFLTANCGAQPSLTPRELKIVQLVSDGNSSKEVATTLGISIKTVETHRTNIMRKLDLSSVGDLVRYAIRNNLVEP